MAVPKSKTAPLLDEREVIPTVSFVDPFLSSLDPVVRRRLLESWEPTKVIEDYLAPPTTGVVLNTRNFLYVNPFMLDH